jgi:hypothetical protein
LHAAGAANEAACAQGFTCVTLDGQNYTCNRICNKTTPGAICGAQTCNGFNPAFVINAVEYGVCS